MMKSAQAPCLFITSVTPSSFKPTNPLVSTSKPRQYSVLSQYRVPSIRRLRASANPEQDRPTGNTPEDELLQNELRAKVKELYGGRQNVQIDVDKDSSSVQFTVRNRPSSSMSSSSTAIINDVFRSRRYILTFIIVVSLITGTFFTALYYSGAVHGLDPSDESRYEMPTYGTKSYIDPYELLDKEAQQLQQQQQSSQVPSKLN